ncbi:MAG: phage portal protein [Caldilineaceae bacterium]
MGFLTRILGPKEERSISESSMMALLRSGLNGASATAAGVVVSPEGSLQVTTVFACVRVLAESLASLPLLLYQRQGQAKLRMTDHPLYPILHDLPNPEMTSMELRETMMGHLALRGNAYANKVYDGAGRIRELWPLRPDRMQVLRREESSELIYQYTLPSGEMRYLPTQEVMHLRGISPDGINGYGPITLARQAIGLAMGTEEYGARFFGNGARATTVLKHPGKLSDKAFERLRDSWEARHQGLENAHRVAILEEGMAVDQVGLAPEDAQFLQTRKFQKGEICAIFRVPPHMAGDLERATFGNIEHQSLEFVMYTLRPWVVRWEQGIARDLLTAEERKVYLAEFLLDGLLRGDLSSRYAAYAVGRQNGWLSANDIRGFENLNPIPGGDVYLVPLNMVPADQAAKPAENAPAQQRTWTHVAGLPECQCEQCRAEHVERETRNQDDEHGAIRENKQKLARSYQPLMADVAGRVVRRECNDVRRAVDKHLRKRSAADFRAWLVRFYDDFPVVVRDNFQAIMETYGAQVATATADELKKVDQGLTEELHKFIDRYLNDLANGHAASSRNQLLKLLEDAAQTGKEPADLISERLDGWEETRADSIAKHETFSFGNAFAVAAYLGFGVHYLRWLATGKSCPFCTHLNGHIVGIDENFVAGGTNLDGGVAGLMLVRRDTKHGPLHQGCDCVVMAA